MGQSSGLGRRGFLRAVGGALASSAIASSASSGAPNVIVILADDLGYGDVGCFGSSIPTPNLDQMAKDGIRLTRFYSASPVCSPSRAALLTGRYPVRTGVVNVLMPWEKRGLSSSERTIPKILREVGYRTGCIGKWHLGSQPGFLACDDGFDEFYGLPYSNDMSPLPVMRDLEVIEQAPPQSSLIGRFTSRAVDFIARQDGSKPFFLYLAHTAPHIPLAPSEAFRGKSEQGPYGDVVMELDWSVGQVLDALTKKGIADNTLVIFTSDNGPWYQGSAGRLQGRKGSTYEGGVREPFIARFPGKIPAGSEGIGVGSMMDLLPTISKLAGAAVPADSVDGIDIWPMLTGEQAFISREPLLFFDGWQLQCARWGPWKLHLSRYNSYAWTADPVGGRVNLPLKRPELYHVDQDPAESYDRASERGDIVDDLKKRVEQLLTGMPGDVINAWRDTQSERVQDTPTGALPSREISR